MQAHGAKAHIRDHGGNSFADMLAATGDKATAEEQAPTAQTAPPTNAGAAAPGAQAGQDTDAMPDDAPDDAPDDTQASATAPQILAGISSQGAKPQVSSGKDVGDKTADDKDKVKPQEAQPANDNSAAAQVMPQPMPAPPPAAANGTPGDASAACRPGGRRAACAGRRACAAVTVHRRHRVTWARGRAATVTGCCCVRRSTTRVYCPEASPYLAQTMNVQVLQCIGENICIGILPPRPRLVPVVTTAAGCLSATR